MKHANTQNYKSELDRQKALRDQMKAYGNMSAAEKAINKDDLFAYKEYDAKNYAMLPGIQPTKQINVNRLSASPDGKMSGSLSPKRFKETAEKVLQN